MDFPGLAGNGGIKSTLGAAMQRRSLSHAYIIAGPEGSGKRTLANIIAAALVCSGRESRPCGECSHCRKAANGIHPDIRTIDSGGRELVVGRIRDELRADAYVRPNEADCKVYIVVHTQDMNFSAQNAMLAILEDPPGYVFTLLLTENADALLPTVRSRCVELSMQRLEPAQALPVLKARFPGVPDARVLDAFSLSGGFIGRAAELLGREDEPQFFGQAQRFLALLAQGSELSLLEHCVSLEKLKREDFAFFADALSVILHGALINKTGGGAFPGKGNPENMLSAKLTGAQLLKLMELVQKIRQYCDYNAGVAHMAGMLAASSWEIRSGT